MKVINNEISNIAVGDAAITSARWRFVQLEHNALFVVIDRCAVQQLYRRKGYGRKVLEAVLADICKVVAAQSIDLKGVYLQVPDEEWLVLKLKAAGFLSQDIPPEMRGNCSFITLYLDRSVFIK